MGTFSSNTELAEKLNIEFAKNILPVTILVGIEACVGFVGNVLVLYVFSFKYRKCNFKYFVLFLALIDLTSCLTTVPGEMVTQMFWYTYPVLEVCKAKSFCNIFTVCASALCLLLIAIDRYRKICKPFGWQVKPEMAIYLCIGALVIAGVASTPVPIFWGIQHYNVSNVTVRSCEPDDIYKDTEDPFIFSSVIEAIISIPLVVMPVLYFLIAREIRGSMQKTRAKRSNTSDSVEIHETVLYTSGKENFKISKDGMMNEDGTDDERNEDKDSHTSITSVDDESEDRQYFPDTRSEDMLPNPDRRNTEVEKVKSRNAIDTLDPERVDGIKPNKSKHINTKQKDKDKVRSVSNSPSVVCVNMSDHKRKMSSERVNYHIKRKTLIMFILSAVFFISTILYLTLLSLIARKDNILRTLTPKQIVVYFFFFRLYFIHHVINPFLYVFLDSHFRKALKEMTCKIKNRRASFIVTTKM